MLIALVCLYFSIVLVLLCIAPFPHWPSYLCLWKQVIIKNDTTPLLPISVRVYYAYFLLSVLATAPVHSLLWWMDRLMFDHRELMVRLVCIVGQPRSGTTALHRMLMQDGRTFVGAPHLLWRYPYISLHILLRVTGLYEVFASQNYWNANEAGAAAAKMHKNTLGDFEEDDIFWEERFMFHYFLTLRFPYMDMLKYYNGYKTLPGCTKTHFMTTHKEVLQKAIFLKLFFHQDLKENELFFLSKTPETMEMMEDISNTYPDAHYIVPIRDSKASFNSQLTLARTSTLSKCGVDVKQIARYVPMMLEKKKIDCLEQQRLLNEIFPPSRTLVISFKDYHLNNLDTLGHIYQLLKLSHSPVTPKQTFGRSGVDYGYDFDVAFDELDNYILEKLESNKISELKTSSECSEEIAHKSD
eukprot:TRINITY_DN5179_c0_g1_i1.p1 TRINITY_DN5179_c0_g1~~TRINITY_DN5179_c0_g1_i1.p1  ORF type:complete len:412 (+),score=60.51 TRINITY_DN5179_c0_g1_i1:62-1297(+)